ncbi:carbamoyl-phosphate synth [Wallemia mellicola]|uniref:Ammonium-dependent carbamoyl phosphate synthetase n=1 Tax=Wallemia mellicola TaxID=1708541 RepID=A0A4T0SIF3_9BASI|nr:carbamoyl-phosphate synth [Wallemia mellicola]TIC63712.1 carbamoyl-phosphate synth [Wallemia mellicola]
MFRTPTRKFITAATLSGLYLQQRYTYNNNSSLSDRDLQDLPTTQLVRSWVVYLACSSPTLIDAAPDLINYASHLPGIWQITKFVVKRTFFAQFTGGESSQEYTKVIDALRQHTQGVILNYSAEASDISPSHSQDAMLAAAEDSLRIISEGVQACGTYEKQLRDNHDKRAGQTFVAVKPSGLIPDPYVLERATLALNELHGWNNTLPAQMPVESVSDSDMQLMLGKAKLSNISKEDLKQLAGLYDRMRNICGCAYDNGVKILIDAEYAKFQPAIDVMFTLLAEEFNYDRKGNVSQTVQPVVYNTIQCSLRRSEDFVKASIKRAQEKGYTIGLKVVRGAYVDHENSRWAKLKGVGPSPVWGSKEETDRCFDNVAEHLVEELASANGNTLGVLFASHNCNSAFKVLDLLEKHKLASRTSDNKVDPIPPIRERIAFGQLYGMADKLSSELSRSFTDGPPMVFRYLPFAKLEYALPYLLRRATENKEMSGAPSPPSNPLELAPSQPPAAHALAKQSTVRNNNGILYPATAQPAGVESDYDTALELEDGSVNFGYSFGAKGKSISGDEGMVGYPESLTDPSYAGQILVLTYPLVGNYGVPARPAETNPLNLPEEFESAKIHVAGLVVSTYAPDYSHFLANSSLGTWLQEQGIPAVFGVDTRNLTKKIREKGVMLGRILARKNGDRSGRPLLSQPAASLSRSVSTASMGSAVVNDSWKEDFQVIPFTEYGNTNLVAQVSLPTPLIFKPTATPLKHPKEDRNVRILTVDVGIKYNQIRCFNNRGVEVKLVPWDYDFLNESEPYDGLFVSNGPGDPATVTPVIEKLRTAVDQTKTPIFGICLGHQLLSLAVGAKTKKMKYGNRGANIPCTDMQSGRCYITSQNHGYAVDADTLPEGVKELFVNANDGSNEGTYLEDKPVFSVQFHPESTPGPRDTEFLFDVFINSVVDFAKTGVKKQIVLPGGTLADNAAKYPRVDVKKVLVLGSGGLSIGQAGEFDYSGSQAIKALKQEGIYTVLVNPNIATIQTSGLADKVYFLPVNPDSVRKIIKHERPDGIYVTFGGQTALNVGCKLKDEFEALGVKVLGTPVNTIEMTEDRELFARAMEEIGEHCAPSASANSLDEALQAAKNIGYPVIARAAYTLGGLGSGFADDEKSLTQLCNKAFATSPQVLIEKSMKGWKEIEYEVVRDCRDNCITVCNMENFDPLGIHTGDSIVVAPSQTLSDADYNMLRSTAVKVIRHLGVVGECNIQYALNPHSKEYCIIEVNARLSRSSALASKATGYPLAYTAAKLGLNIPLNEIRNSVTRSTTACFEPSLDYCVVKIPRWDLKKFNRVNTALNSSMKSVGEVMAIGRSFEETIQKAIRCIDDRFYGFGTNPFVMEKAEIDEELVNPTDRRVFAIANAFVKGYTVDQIHKMSNIDRWFLNRLKNLIEQEKILSSEFNTTNVTPQLLRQSKQMGFSDRQLAKFLGSNELAVRRLRQESGIVPHVKQIDTVAAEFPAFTNYLYTTYNAGASDIDFEDKGVIVLGSGVYRIGSSVEFDWCAVSTIRTLRSRGVKTVMINYNPETVSTDYDEADRLYFENISLETVLDIYDAERSTGVILSMGGQTPNNIALPLYRQNVHIYGTSPEMIDTAENRYKFSRMLDKIGVDQPQWKELSSFDEAYKFCQNVGFPVLVRPSYVLSGAAMNVVSSPDDLENYLTQATAVSQDYPVVISKFIEDAKEIEMDAIAKDGKMIMHYISEHIENAGVHSGDATLVLPPQDLAPETVRRIVEATAKIGEALNVTGPYNIQFIAKNNEIKVIECNLRAARSFPFVSKVTNVDAIALATNAMLGFTFTPYPEISLPEKYVGVKVPQFSFSRLSGADPVLGVEMASTGEVACFGRDKYEAYIKALMATGMHMPKKNILFSIGSYKEKMEMLPAVQNLHRQGYNLFATSGTADFIQEHGIPVKYLEAITETDSQKSEYSLTQHLANNLIDLYINLPSKNRYRRPASYMSKGYQSRRMAVDYAVPLVTNVKCAKLLIEAIVRKPSLEVDSVDYKTSHRTFTLPGLINVQAYTDKVAEANSGSFEKATLAALEGGFTVAQVIPMGVENGKSLQAMHTNAVKSRCDYVLSVSATPDNVDGLDAFEEDVQSLYIPFNKLSGNVNKVATIASHFGSWPSGKPIVTDARSTDLASILLLASLHGRSIHVTNVSNRDDISLIALSKGRDLKVTCDVAVYSLFFSREDYPEATVLPTKKDQKALWDNLDKIDMFSVGTVPHELAVAVGQGANASAGMAESVSLLLSAVAEQKLTLEDVISRFHDAPKAIFDLPDQPNTYVEVEMDRASSFSASEGLWSPLNGKPVKGQVDRVVFYGKTVRLAGVNVSKSTGRDLTVAGPIRKQRNARTSFSQQTRPATQSITGIPSPTKNKDGLSSPVDGTQPRSFMSALDPLSTGKGDLTALKSHPAFKRRHILSVKQFTRDDLHVLFTLASELRTHVEKYGSADILKGRVLCSLFFEPSTRTSASFDAAMKRCGGTVVTIPVDRSSVAKGESLADTIRTLGCYADGVVMRHPVPGSVQTASKFSPVPIINAGDGTGEHPTQAFLDIYTIREELGTVNGLTITMVGDLKNGRTVHSLVKLLNLYNVHLNFVSPPSLNMPDSIKAECRKSGVTFHETARLDDVIGKSDVIYMTRVQQERFNSVHEFEAVKDAYILDNATMDKAKPSTIVLHPLPRLQEIDPNLDFDNRAAYFRQMRYGLFARMALLSLILE